jgi:hypothetical protein
MEAANGQIRFDAFFRAATGHDPFDYQCRLASGDLAWLWNRIAPPPLNTEPSAPIRPQWPRTLVD